MADQESPYLLPTYHKMPLTLVRGQGVFVFDDSGRRYLDLYGGHAVATTGHGHPRIVDAIARQARDLLFYSNVVRSPVRAEAARRLVEAAGTPFEQVFFVNSGAEANEAAMRTARKMTGRRKMVSLEGSFHGRTLGAASVTGIGNDGKQPDVELIPPEDAERARAAVDEMTAAVILEPIQSMSGVRVLSAEFLRLVRDLTRERGALLVFDEVQTGAGRMGSYLFSGTHGVHADLVTLAKGIASGVPMGAMLATGPVAREVRPGDLGSTFGGGPLACAALVATLEVLEQERLLERVRETSEWLAAELASIRGVEEVRGRGYLVGLRLSGPAKKAQERLLEHGILAGTASDPKVLRLMPPLILERSHASAFLEVLPSCL